MITINANGRMGNRLHYFIAAMHCHKLSGMQFTPERINGFVKTYDRKDGTVYNDIKSANDLYSDRENFFENVKNLKNGLCMDFMIHRYEYFKKIGRENVIDYLEIENEDHYDTPEDNELVLHIRLGDYAFAGGGSITDKSLYLKCISIEAPKKCTILTDEPNNAYLDDFKRIGCVIRSADALADFVYIKKAKKSCISKSTFSWLAAYISNADKVYFPISDNKWPYFADPKPDETDFRPLDLQNWVLI